MGLADIKTTEWLLINWARWAYSNRGVSLNFSAIEPYERMRTVSPPGPAITDEEGEIIDKAVSQLRLARPKEGDTLARYYLCETSYRSLGKKMGKHHKIIADWVRDGKFWIEGRLVHLFNE